MLKYFMLLCTLSTCMTSKKSSLSKVPTNSSEVITIAVGGDWDDQWGPNGATTLSLTKGASHDLILMLGDLSYDGIDHNYEYNRNNAKKWASKANKIAGTTPMLFVAGDHDSKNQDGDIMTYAKTLNFPNGRKSVGTYRNSTQTCI